MKNLIRLFVFVLMLFGIFSCNSDDTKSTSYLIMEMKLVHTLFQDTVVYNFSYLDNQLKEATIKGQGINETYTADFDNNGKVIDAGDKRFEWDGDLLVKIIDDNGIWIDIAYSGNQLIGASYSRYDNNNEIEKLGDLDITFNGQNLSKIENANSSGQVLSAYTFSGFDSKVNLFKAIWWFHYVGETLGTFGSGIFPDALFMDNNPGTYKYELPQQTFERTINYTYSYDEQGRVTLVEYEVGGDDFELIINY